MRWSTGRPAGPVWPRRAETPFGPRAPVPRDAGGGAAAIRRRRLARAPLARALAALLAAAVIAVVGCDAEGVPTALVVAAESEAALQIAEELPTLPWFAGRLEARLDPASRRTVSMGVAVWEESLEAGAPAPEGELRERVYDAVIPVLAPRLVRADLEAAHRALAAWLQMATPVVAEARIAALEARLDEGRRLANELASALSDDTGAEWGLLLALRAADVLLETTPRVIALRLTAWGEGMLAAHAGGAGAGGGAVDSLSLARADRLLRGAREAIASRDYILAIRRAFYARQLLDPGCGVTC